MVSASRRWTRREGGAHSARWARVASAGLALAALFVARGARAELNLRWSAPAGCPTKDDVLRRMRSLGVTLSRVSADLSVSGSIAEEGNGFLLSVWVREGNGERRRTIRNESCSDLANAAAVTLALLLDVELSAPAGDQPGQGDSRGESPPSRPAPSSPPRPAEPTAPARGPRSKGETPGAHGRYWQLVVMAPGAVATIGPFSKPSWGAGAGLGLHFNSWRLALRGSAFARQTLTTFAEGQTFGAVVQRVSAGLTACYHSKWGRLELGPCGSLRLERVVADGVGDGVRPTTQYLHWPTASVGALGRLQLLPFLAVAASIDLDWNAVRPRLVIGGLGEVERVAAAGAAGNFWVEWIF